MAPKSDATVNSAVNAATDIREGLGFLVRWSRMSFYDEIQRRSGERLDRSAITVLSYLGVGEEIRQSELADLIGVDRSTISRQISEMVKRGLVGTRPDERDKRATVLFLTPHGSGVHRKIADAWAELVRELLEGWSGEEAVTCARLLTRLIAGLRDPYEGPRPH